MKKRFILLSLMICLLLTGCKSVQDMTLEEIVLKKVNRTVETYNTYRKGYKYFLPSGLGVIESTDYNEVLRDENYRYYLYIDAVSYFNKVIETYEVSEDAYVSMPINYNIKYGYLEINKKDEDKYFIEIMYNYAKIEVIVKEKDINVVVSNAMNILSSIKFNDNILKTLLGDETSQLNEFEFNIFETTTTSTESDYLQALDKDNAEAEKDYIHDSDLIN
ncbi:MAG: hypothetical protein II625_08560 [Bacilli bacterium]|nr:hypothetical protein [Bacilli bacterium]